MVSLNKMHGFYYKFQPLFSANVCYCITADKTLFHQLNVFLYVRSKKNIHNFFSSKKYCHYNIHKKINNQSTYLQIYTPLTTDAKSWWKRVPTQTHKRIWEACLLKHYFLFYGASSICHNPNDHLNNTLTHYAPPPPPPGDTKKKKRKKRRGGGNL